VRILHINLERGWRGGERQTLYLMEGLRALGHECRLLARPNELFIGRTLKAGIPATSIKKPFLFHGSLLKGWDVIHAHESRGLQMAASWKPLHKRPIVYTRRVDYIPSRQPFTRMVYRRIDRLVAISSKIESVMRLWGFDPGMIRVIKSSVPLETSQSTDKVGELRARFGSRKVVGCIAALVGHKDHATLLKAASILDRTRPDVVFLLIGDGPLMKDLGKLASDLGLSNVIFEGYVEDPYPYFEIFDVFAMTSKEEGLGSSILDAFRYRVPVVATDAGGMPELVKDGETGLLVRVGDFRMVAEAVVRFLDDGRTRLECTENAHALVSKDFTVEAMSKAYEEVYLEVLAGKGHNAV
jgi:glycosyltransferase involved in cell wall biosynthesis